MEKNPNNLDECIEFIVSSMTEKDLQWAKGCKDKWDFIALLHHGYGTSLRNNWGLWDKESILHKYFRNIGIWHADDMSGIILTSVYRKIKGQEIDLEGQIKFYQEYWAKEGIGFDKQGRLCDFTNESYIDED